MRLFVFITLVVVYCQWGYIAMHRILTVEQAADKLQVKPNTVRSWLKSGKIPGRKIGRVYRISEDELEMLLRKKEPKPRISAKGLLAHVPGSVEDFMRRKQEEIDLEDRRWREHGA